MARIGKSAARPIKLPIAPGRYDQNDINRTRRLIEAAFAQYGISISSIAQHIDTAPPLPTLPVSGAVAWYDMQYLMDTGLADGDPITSVPNLVESYLSEAIPSGAAKLEAAAINGHPAYVSDGGADTISYAGPVEYAADTPTFPFTILLAYYIDVDWTPGPGGFAAGSFVGVPLYGNNGIIEFGSQAVGLTETNWYVNSLLFADQAGNSPYSIFQTGQQPAPGYHTFAIVVRAEDDYDIVIDGVKYTGTTPYLVADDADSFCFQGADAWGTGFVGFPIMTLKCGEFIRYDTALNDTDRETLEAYMVARWS